MAAQVAVLRVEGERVEGRPMDDAVLLPVKTSVAGTFAGMAQALVGYPFDTVKVRPV